MVEIDGGLLALNKRGRRAFRRMVLNYNRRRTGTRMVVVPTSDGAKLLYDAYWQRSYDMKLAALKAWRADYKENQRKKAG